MSIRVLVLLTGLMVIVHDEARAVSAPMALDPREQLFESKKATTSEPTAAAPVGAKPILPKPPEGATVERVSTGNPLWAIPLSRLTATRERPLFAPTRLPPPVAAIAKPAAPTAPPPRPVEPETPQLSLVGTVVGRERMGLFIDSATKAVLRLKAGENHKGWILRAVSRHQVELARGLDVTVLDLPSPDMKAGALPPGMPMVAGAPPGTPMVARAPPGMPAAAGVPPGVLANTSRAAGARPMGMPASAVVRPSTPNSPPTPVRPLPNAPNGSAR